MTSTKLFLLGQLGKPHALNGYLYLNPEVYFRNFNLSQIDVTIDNSLYTIENYKKHLKNRFLVKFNDLDSISSIENFRGKKIYISSMHIDKFINDELPWPGFFISSILNNQYKVKDFFYAGELMYLTIVYDKEYTIPYNSNFFEYKDSSLEIVNFDLFH